VLHGDANKPAHLERVASLLDPKALIIAYLDTARPQDLHWTTVEYLATSFDHIDLIINVPVNNLMRAILGRYHAGGTGPGVAGRFLNQPTPSDLIRPSLHRVSDRATIDAIRDHYDSQLMSLGFKQPARRTVWFPATNPYYDVLYASRHRTGIELWNKTNPLDEDPQLSMLPPP
jgi:hypothetical protein